MISFRIPGPQCSFGSDVHIDDGTLPLCRLLPPGPLSVDLLTGRGRMSGTLSWAEATWWTPVVPVDAAADASAAPATPPPITTLDNDTRMLAATAYGEGSTDDVFEEMAAIANVLVRQRQARGYASDAAFIAADKTFAFAAHDGNKRYAKLMKASIEAINADAGMAAAVRGAQNARADEPQDYSNGAYFWDGEDIRTKYAKNAKVLVGIHFTDPKHNVLKIKDKDVPGEHWVFDAKGKKTKSRGTWKYAFESTAGWGSTIFWKYNADYMRANGNTVFK